MLDTVLSVQGSGSMLREFVLAIGIPLVLLLLAVLALERSGGQLPLWLQRIKQRRALLWKLVIGLVIVLSLLRWLLHR